MGLIILPAIGLHFLLGTGVVIDEPLMREKELKVSPWECVAALHFSELTTGSRTARSQAGPCIWSGCVRTPRYACRKMCPGKLSSAHRPSCCSRGVRRRPGVHLR